MRAARLNYSFLKINQTKFEFLRKIHKNITIQFPYFFYTRINLRLKRRKMRRRNSKVKHLFAVSVAVFLLAFFSFSVKSENNTGNQSARIFEISRPALKTFTDKDGLPLNSVMSLERDSHGYLWIGTQDGAAYFNGNDITVVNMPNRLISNYVFDILAASDGKIWFAASDGGLHVRSGKDWQTHRKKDGLISDEIRCLLETFDETGKQIIWVGTREGLSKFHDNVWTNFTAEKDLPDNRIRSLLETVAPDGRKTLWIGTYKGVSQWQGGEKKVFDTRSGLPGNVVFSLLETKNRDNQSVIWAGTDKGLAKFENGVWHTFEKEAEILTKGVRALNETVKADGTKIIWVGFEDDGLAFFENSRWNFLNEKQGLPNNLVFALETSGAPDGSVWISTLGAGISRFEKSNWRTVDDKNGLPGKIVFSVNETFAADGKKSIWFGTYGKGLARFEEGKWTIFDTTDGLPSNFIHCLFVSERSDEKSVLYVGTESGLAKFENGKFQNISEFNDIPNKEIWNIFETEEAGKRVLWVGTNGGLIRSVNGEKQIFDKKNGLPDQRIRSMLETVSPSGAKTLWVGTYGGGLAKFENGNWTIFNQESGLPNNRIYSLAETKINEKRLLLIGTAGGAAILNMDAEGSSFQILSSESGHLPNDSVNRIFIDNQNRIYAATNQGVARLTPTGSDAEQNFDAYFFTTEDGLPSNETIAGASYIDSQNRIWIGTVGGAAMLDISQEYPDTTADSVFLEKVLIGGKESELKPETELAYNENNLIFYFAMPSGFRESGTRYQTQLVGMEEKPTDWTNEPRREIGYLPSGEFIFKVWGKDASGNISAPLEIPFSVSPAWWQTWFAFILYLLAAAGVAGLIVYTVYRNRLQRMFELEQVRTRIASDLHDDIGASLSQISILSELLAQKNGENGNEETRSLNIIAETSRELTGSMSDVVWAINPKRDNLRDLIQRMRRFASDILSAKDIDFTFSVPKENLEMKLDVDIRQQIYLVFKESVNNAVKHSECTNVEIEFKLKDKNFFLRVSDDGKGFEIGEESDGNGLNSMRSRAANAGGKLEILSEKEKATTVILNIPHKSSAFI